MFSLGKILNRALCPFKVSANANVLALILPQAV